jgi:hypothetical protein
MRQRHILTFTILLVTHTVFGQYALAELAIKDKSEIAGTWLLEATAIRRDGEKTPEQGKWVFGEDGVLSTTNFYKFSGHSGKLTERYEIKEGEIVAERSGKFKLIGKQGQEMILKGPFGYYFFKKE